MLPADERGGVAQALEPHKMQTFSVGAASARNGTAFDPDTVAIELRGTVDLFFRLGDAPVVAASTDYPLFSVEKGIVYAIGTNRRLAAIWAIGSGTIYITELK